MVQFLHETAGSEAARAEARPADRRSARALALSARAGLDFAEDRQAEPIAALRALIKGTEPSDAVRDVQLELAEMLEAGGDAAGRDAPLAAARPGDHEDHGHGPRAPGADG